MANYISWYLVELEKRFAGKLPMRKVLDLQREVEDHLRQSAEESQKLGSDPAVAEKLAIESFGSPRTFVKRTIQNLCDGHISPKVLSAQSVYAILLVAVLSYFAALRWGLLFSDSLLLLIPFAILSFFAKRTPWKAAVATALVAGPILFAATGYFMVRGWRWDTYVPLGKVSEYIDQRLEQKQRIDHDLVILRSGMKAYGVTSTSKILPMGKDGIPAALQLDGGYVIPKSYEYYDSQNLTYNLDQTANYVFQDSMGAVAGTVSEARQSWKKNAEQWEQAMVLVSKEITLDVNRMKSFKDGGHFDGSVATALGGPAVFWALGFVLPCAFIPAWTARMFGYLRLRRRALA